MKILEKEIALREETRTAEQARPAVSVDKHSEEALKLAETQDELAIRTGAVVEMIRELPDGETSFPKEIMLLSRVQTVMDEARIILAGPNTGPEAIAAETEAIELLLQAKRINPKGGGGGGASPGGGGSGTTETSALALLGEGDDDEANVEERIVSQATGVTGRQLPEEYRHGLDQFFNAIENAKAAAQP